MISTIGGLFDLNHFDQSSRANDVIVIRHRDGSLHSTPFNVRFGRARIWNSINKVVQIEVNGVMTKAVMKIGKGGEAFWLHPTYHRPFHSHTQRIIKKTPTQHKSITRNVVDGDDGSNNIMNDNADKAKNKDIHLDEHEIANNKSSNSISSNNDLQMNREKLEIKYNEEEEDNSQTKSDSVIGNNVKMLHSPSEEKCALPHETISTTETTQIKSSKANEYNANNKTYNDVHHSTNASAAKSRNESLLAEQALKAAEKAEKRLSKLHVVNELMEWGVEHRNEADANKVEKLETVNDTQTPKVTTSNTQPQMNTTHMMNELSKQMCSSPSSPSSSSLLLEGIPQNNNKAFEHTSLREEGQSNGGSGGNGVAKEESKDLVLLPSEKLTVDDSNKECNDSKHNKNDSNDNTDKTNTNNNFKNNKDGNFDNDDNFKSKYDYEFDEDDNEDKDEDDEDLYLLEPIDISDYASSELHNTSLPRPVVSSYDDTTNKNTIKEESKRDKQPLQTQKRHERERQMELQIKPTRKEQKEEELQDEDKNQAREYHSEEEREEELEEELEEEQEQEQYGYSDQLSNWSFSSSVTSGLSVKDDFLLPEEAYNSESEFLTEQDDLETREQREYKLGNGKYNASNQIASNVKDGQVKHEERQLEEEHSTSYFTRSLLPSEIDLNKLNLRNGANEVKYVTRKSYDTPLITVSCNIYLWNYNDKIIVSDIDGTITKSDLWGHFYSMLGKGGDWTHPGICALYTKIVSNGYKMLYLSARSVTQIYQTKNYLWSLEQDKSKLPLGPVLTAPLRIFTAITKEVSKQSHIFKIACLTSVLDAFPEHSKPFFAGFGNRYGDVVSYNAVHIPIYRIFIIDPSSILHVCRVKQTYRNLTHLVDMTFPPLKSNALSLYKLTPFTAHSNLTLKENISNNNPLRGNNVKSTINEDDRAKKAAERERTNLQDFDVQSETNSLSANDNNDDETRSISSVESNEGDWKEDEAKAKEKHLGSKHSMAFDLTNSKTLIDNVNGEECTLCTMHDENSACKQRQQKNTIQLTSSNSPVITTTATTNTTTITSANNINNNNNNNSNKAVDYLSTNNYHANSMDDIHVDPEFASFQFWSVNPADLIEQTPSTAKVITKTTTAAAPVGAAAAGATVTNAKLQTKVHSMSTNRATEHNLITSQNQQPLLLSNTPDVPTAPLLNTNSISNKNIQSNENKQETVQSLTSASGTNKNTINKDSSSNNKLLLTEREKKPNNKLTSDQVNNSRLLENKKAQELSDATKKSSRFFSFARVWAQNQTAPKVKESIEKQTEESEAVREIRQKKYQHPDYLTYCPNDAAVMKSNMSVQADNAEVMKADDGNNNNNINVEKSNVKTSTKAIISDVVNDRNGDNEVHGQSPNTQKSENEKLTSTPSPDTHVNDKILLSPRTSMLSSLAFWKKSVNVANNTSVNDKNEQINSASNDHINNNSRSECNDTATDVVKEEAAKSVTASLLK